MFVLGMWDKNYINGENQMEASDFDLHSDQDSKSNKMLHPSGTVSPLSNAGMVVPS